MRRILAPVLTLALAAGLLAVTAPAAVAAETVPVWAADFMAGSTTPSRDRAVTQAKHFDVIAALKGTYADHVDAMKAANPDLVLMVYLNGTMAQAGEGSAFPGSWYLRDRAGNKVKSRGWGNYLMNPAEPGWQKAVADRCRAYLDESGYDGCFLDVLGTAPLNSSYVTALPVNPATRDPWRRSGWLRATTAVARATRDEVSPAPVFGNGLANGSLYFGGSAPSSSILGGLDGGMAESFVRDAYAPAGSFRSATLWRRDVNLLRDVAAKGDAGLAITKVWSSASKRQTNAVQRYALATFLLGYKPGLSFYSFRDDHGLTGWRSAWGRAIGAPTGSYRKVGDSYVRAFSGGVVVVNPTGSRTHVSLGGAYRRAGGTVSRVTLRAHHASILLEA
jgi:putative glycosyl hydrolase-like family 15 (GHL15) protein